MSGVVNRSKDYIIETIDKTINELVYNKFKLQKAYNYYNGVRDSEQFRYLEDNFGIGTPTAVEFTPLIRKHVDALVGEYLDIPTLPKISCKDSNTLSAINRDLELEIKSQVFQFYKSKLNNDMLQFFQTGQNNTQDEAIDKQLKKLVEDINDNYISDYEIAAQNVLEYVIQSRNTDLQNRKRLLLLDLLIGGCAYFKVKKGLGDNLVIEVLNPLNTFVDRDPSSQYVKDGYRAVCRKWMTKQQILSIYGKDLTKDSIAELNDMFEHEYDQTSYYIRTQVDEAVAVSLDGDLDNGKTVMPGFPEDGIESYNYKLLPVYEVEWIETDKERNEYVQNRYEGVRIGESIYIPTGKSKNVIRTADNPNLCTLSIGGVYLLNRNNNPTSIVQQCMHLQDKYDVVCYLRDNLLANSGTIGDWLDVSMLPSFLGDEMTERLQKWQAYKKAGLAMLDSSQEGRGFNNNTFTSGFDDAVKLQTVQAFDLVLQRIEEQTSSITGVFRERLNGINQKDAVSNVEAGARNSFTITKPFYQQMDTLVIDILSDCLDMAKIIWKKGVTGTIILGDKLQKVFTALPEHFTHTDYDIHIVPTTQILKDMQNMQQLVIEMIKGGMMEPDIASEAMTSRSLTELKDKMRKSWAKKKEENNQLGQLSQQLQEAQQQMQQLQQQNQQLSSKVEQLNESKLQLEKQKIDTEAEIKWYQAQTDREFKTKSAENDSKKVEIELLQLYDGNPYNNKVNFEK